MSGNVQQSYSPDLERYFIFIKHYYPCNIKSHRFSSNNKVNQNMSSTVVSRCAVCTRTSVTPDSRIFSRRLMRLRIRSSIPAKAGPLYEGRQVPRGQLCR